jgi:hypothetical protein
MSVSVKTAVFVDGATCRRLAGLHVFVDLIEFARLHAADLSVFVSVIYLNKGNNKPLTNGKRLFKRLSSVYELHVSHLYPRDTDNATATHVAAVLSLLRWVSEQEGAVSVVLLSESAYLKPVIDDLLSMQAQVTLFTANTALRNAIPKTVDLKTYESLPLRSPEILGDLQTRENYYRTKPKQQVQKGV